MIHRRMLVGIFLALTAPLFGKYTNNGTMHVANFNVNAGELFDENGHIEGTNITITTEKFAYTGTIVCNELCVVRSENVINPSSATFKGPGTFVLFCTDPTKPILIKDPQNSSSFEEVSENLPLQKREELFLATTGNITAGLTNHALTKEQVTLIMQTIIGDAKRWHLNEG